MVGLDDLSADGAADFLGVAAVILEREERNRVQDASLRGPVDFVGGHHGARKLHHQLPLLFAHDSSLVLCKALNKMYVSLSQRKLHQHAYTK